MALYTLADLHLPLGIDKPMDIFGKAWENYVERLADNWQSVVKENDVVVLPGDFSAVKAGRLHKYYYHLYGGMERFSDLPVFCDGYGQEYAASQHLQLCRLYDV